MKDRHFISDLRAFTEQLRARRQRNIDQVREKGRELTDVEGARFEVGHGLATDILRDLDDMLKAWGENHAAYRATEEMLEREGDEDLAEIEISVLKTAIRHLLDDNTMRDYAKRETERADSNGRRAELFEVETMRLREEIEELKKELEAKKV